MAKKKRYIGNTRPKKSVTFVTLENTILTKTEKFR
jgi:hypothetical protein